MFWLAYRALKGRPGLTFLSIVGVALAVGLAVSVPVFAQAVNRAIMEEQLAQRTRELNRSALSIRHYVLPSSQNPITAQACQEYALYIGRIYEANLGLPVTRVQTRVESGGMIVKSAEEGPYGKAGVFIGNASLGFITGMEDHTDVPVGDPLGTPSGEVLNVWINESWAQELGVQPGERFMVQPVLQGLPITVRVAGTWQPREPRSSFWPAGSESAWRTFLLVRPEDYSAFVEPSLGNMPVGGASWIVSFDETHFVPEMAEQYVKGLQRAEVEVLQMLPNVKTDVTPLPIFQAHLERQRPLTILLFGFMVPIIGFLFYFITLVSRIVVEHQRRVVATVVSRGMSREQVLQFNFYQALILFIPGTPLGILLGLEAARLMGHTVSFLTFEPREALAVSLRSVNPWLVMATLVVALVARLWPSFREARWSMVEYVAHTVRSNGDSLFSKLHPELLLAIPTYYLYRQLQQRGTIALLGWKSSGDIFRDPALFLVPALFMLVVALFAARLFPLIMRLLDRTIAGFLGVVGCLTLRQLGRRSRDYTSSLLLIMVSLSVGVFMASMALSLDQWLKDRTYYPLGADAVAKIEEKPSEEKSLAFGQEPEPLIEMVNPDSWLIPQADLLSIPGVRGATWVGRYRAIIPTSATATARGWFIAIDRRTFPSAAAFRADFSPEPLGELMNRLASQPNGVLVSRKMLEKSNHQVGDILPLKVAVVGVAEREYQARIVGIYDYFPTVYEEESPAVIGNLDHIITTFGGASTYEIWLRADREALESGAVKRGLANVAPAVTGYRDIWEQMAEEREAKERIGVYGTLTLGFLATLILSGIGLLIQYHRSLNERLSRFAMLRAIGLSRAELFAQVQGEYLILLAVGLAAGVGIGIWASRLFIPFFRVSSAEGTLPIPPLLPLLDRPRILIMTAAFGLVQFAAQLGFIFRTMQVELFQVLRMGYQE